MSVAALGCSPSASPAPATASTASSTSTRRGRPDTTASARSRRLAASTSARPHVGILRRLTVDRERRLLPARRGDAGPVFPAGKPKRRISPKNASFSGGGASGDGGSSVRIGMPGVAQWRVSNDGTPWASSAPVPGAA
jgi:hypothetical protein